MNISEKFLQTIHHTLNIKGGYLLLLAVVLASIVLSIGLGIFNIINKAIILASAGRDSQFAFYAADTGGECALYWDRKHLGFPTSIFATSTLSTSPISGAVCAGEDVAVTRVVSEETGTSAKTTFNLPLALDRCTTVTVIKENSGVDTIVDARGYNTCDVSHPRRIERAIRIKY